MKSHSEKAAIASLFTHFQFALSLLTGVVLFPWVVQSVGMYSYGLWLATGEAVSYVLLGDLGVFAVLPWLIAAQTGNSNAQQIKTYVSSAIAIGFALMILAATCCWVIAFVDLESIGISKQISSEVLIPVLVLLGLNGLSFPLRTFEALLVGSQDVVAIGILRTIQSVFAISLTIHLIVNKTGILGLAIATGLPPFAYGLFSLFRVLSTHQDLVKHLPRPSFVDCRYLVIEGFGAWLGGLGYRMMAASNGIILALIGKPELGTIYASTSKLSQMLTPICSTIPDSGLVGVSHIFGQGEKMQAQRTAACLALLYGMLPSIAAVGLVIFNPAIVTWWIGSDFYSGTYINFLICIGMVVSSFAGGLFKLVAVVGCRQTVGWTTIVAGFIYGVLGYELAKRRGLAGLAEATLLVWSLAILPMGMMLLNRVYSIKFSHLVSLKFGRWLGCASIAMTVAVPLGHSMIDHPSLAVLASVFVEVVFICLLIPVIVAAPWPSRVRHWLSRMHFPIKNP